MIIWKAIRFKLFLKNLISNENMHNMLVGQIIPHFHGNFVVKFIAGMELFRQLILYTV